MPAPKTCKSASGNPEGFGQHPSASVRINNFSRSSNFPTVFGRPLSWLVRGLQHHVARWSRVLGCQGATTAMLATSITVLLGFVGLAVEAGNWYLSLRSAATAADLAALAGAAALERGTADYRAVALDTAALNGFSSAEVTVGPPTSGNFTSDKSAVEVVISRPQAISLAKLFISSAPTIRSRAVATAHTDQRVCVLALGGGLSLGGNSTTNAGRCAIAANAMSPKGITVAGNARVRADALVTTGTCTGCTGRDVLTNDNLPPAIITNRPDPITDPFANLQSWTPTPPATCVNLSNQWPKDSETSADTATLPAGQAICGDLTVGPKQTLNLQSGQIYYFNNASLDVRGTINGSNVTLVFTGDPDRIGTIHINAQATGSLSAPANSLIDGHPEAAGLLLYRDVRATNNSNMDVQLNGGATMVLSGGTYFPSSNVVVNGNSALGSNCLAIIGYSLSFSGTADTTVDVSGCNNSQPYPVVRIVRLVE
ncbi:MAG: pilus assembly protein TadG-related protein [Acetobacteraceae bacterium]|nr:pilus assembly protein TadG-related protein [Acetobacteraceae bacterium]